MSLTNEELENFRNQVKKLKTWYEERYTDTKESNNHVARFYIRHTIKDLEELLK